MNFFDPLNGHVALLVEEARPAAYVCERVPGSSTRGGGRVPRACGLASERRGPRREEGSAAEQCGATTLGPSFGPFLVWLNRRVMVKEMSLTKLAVGK